jgi:hypothetical protein
MASSQSGDRASRATAALVDGYRLSCRPTGSGYELETSLREVVVEGEDSVDPMVTHHFEARPVDQGHAALLAGDEGGRRSPMQVLVYPGQLDGGKEIIEEGPQGSWPEAPLHERGALNHHVVVCHEEVVLERPGERFRGGRMVLVIPVEERIHRRRVDEDRHPWYARSNSSS